MITSPRQFEHFHVAQVRGICRLLHAGLKQHKRRAADLATDKKYKVSELNLAANGLTTYLKEYYK
jgi:hypothetical protein